ncbi:hypothetical protein L218DRAFT_999812 [Marasmius fiardii PR-910]|nr:hypothetical protein L218DRAFT_999812 [Marasmius fiardii PR-910]
MKGLDIQKIKKSLDLSLITYATADYDTLNDDQKRSLKTLPTLEAIVKELNEVKKAIEVHEGELAKDLQQKQQETEALERQRISEAIAQAQDTHISLTFGHTFVHSRKERLLDWRP